MSASWFETPPELRPDRGAAERRRELRLLLAELRRAREGGAEWYTWIERGRPRLSEAEYARVRRDANRRGRRAPK